MTGGLLIVALVVGWLFLLAPLVGKNWKGIRKAGRGLEDTRLLHQGGEDIPGGRARRRDGEGLGDLDRRAVEAYENQREDDDLYAGLEDEERAAGAYDEGEDPTPRDAAAGRARRGRRGARDEEPAAAGAEADAARGERALAATGDVVDAEVIPGEEPEAPAGTEAEDIEDAELVDDEEDAASGGEDAAGFPGDASDEADAALDEEASDEADAALDEEAGDEADAALDEEAGDEDSFAASDAYLDPGDVDPTAGRPRGRAATRRAEAEATDEPDEADASAEREDDDAEPAAAAAEDAPRRGETADDAESPAEDDDSSEELTEEEIAFARRRSGRGGWDPETDAQESSSRYQRRARALLVLGGVVVVAVVAAALLGGWWWALPVAAGALLAAYLVALRGQVRQEQALRRRRIRQLRRARLGVRHRDDERLGIPERMRRPGAVIVDWEDSSPDFDLLPVAPAGAKRDFPEEAPRERQTGTLERAAS